MSFRKQYSLPLAIGLFTAMGLGYPSVSVAQKDGGRSSKTVLTQALPAMNGRALKTYVVQVEYGPSAGSPVHSHPCPVIGYVTAGTLRMKVAGQGEVLYHAGETFYEAPNSTHLVSANASASEKAEFVAFFVCDHEAALSQPATGKGTR